MSHSSSIIFIATISLALHTTSTHALNLSSSSSINDRRSFLQTASAATAASFSPAIPLFIPKPASAAQTAPITQSIKVTPIAHTFVSSITLDKAPSIKPLRENDATRFLTNARVVHIFYDGAEDKAQKTFGEVLDLTVKRKKNEGAGVTPGTVHCLCNDDSLYRDIDGLSILMDSSSESLKNTLERLPSGDIVILGPKKSSGTIGNGKVVEETGAACGLSVGGKKGGGLISLLLNGPKDSEPIVVVDGGYSTSTILWYDF